jgi:hypothetical protein
MMEKMWRSDEEVGEIAAKKPAHDTMYGLFGSLC